MRMVEDGKMSKTDKLLWLLRHPASREELLRLLYDVTESSSARFRKSAATRLQRIVSLARKSGVMIYYCYRSGLYSIVQETGE